MEEKPLNIRRIAQLSGCSPSTVSRVLSGRNTSIRISEATRRRILEVCRQQDYHPSIHAARFFSGRAGVIGFLVAAESMLDDDNLSRSFFSVCRELFRYNYRTLPLLGNRPFIETGDYLNIFKRNEIDGLIIWGAQEKHTFLHDLAASGYPFLLLTNRVGNYPAVYAAQQEAVRQLTCRCIGRGAKRIAAIMSRNGDSYRARLAGFLEAAADHEPYLVYGEELTLSDALPLADDVLDHAPDAVICANDETALAVETRCMERGIRIPEDLVLAGGDNIKLSRHCPIPLTTFDQKAAECAAASVEILISHLQNGTALTSREIPTELIWRASLPGGSR